MDAAMPLRTCDECGAQVHALTDSPCTKRSLPPAARVARATHPAPRRASLDRCIAETGSLAGSSLPSPPCGVAPTGPVPVPRSQQWSAPCRADTASRALACRSAHPLLHTGPFARCPRVCMLPVCVCTLRWHSRLRRCYLAPSSGRLRAAPILLPRSHAGAPLPAVVGPVPHRYCFPCIAPRVAVCVAVVLLID